MKVNAQTKAKSIVINLCQYCRLHRALTAFYVAKNKICAYKYSQV
ncbi:hypothetical protein GPLA_2632 [Paraglaciecola polaris LMG 21857]|uniref:Uncharacterized protein n=1 Tax=Paraglaciecola polaris LMG 21857 TaxID=1129793 RepID=K7ADX0_9ALTE|nr:hypothetical protein GPLA_2632 [Paraglaciecola polaris LMG 21857]